MTTQFDATASKSRLRFWTLFLSLASLVSSSLAQSSTMTVSNLDDSGPGSLREAIASAAPNTAITFAVSGTIVLTSGALAITNDLVIAGPGAASLSVSGNDQSRVFQIGSNAMVSITGLAITGGHAPDGGFWFFPPPPYPPPAGGPGGAIYNLGRLSLARCTISSNQAGYGGQYHYQASGATLPGAGGSGGGIYNKNVLSAVGCTFSGNSAGAGGYGGTTDYGYGHWTANPGGAGGFGGAICNHGDLFLTNCTLSGNQGGAGGNGGAEGGPWYMGANGGGGGCAGGIFSTGTLTLVACTLAANAPGTGGHGGYSYNSSGSAGKGGGIYTVSGASSAQLRNTLAGANSGTNPDLAGAFTSLGHNLISQINDATGFTNGVNSDLAGTYETLDPVLGQLQNNGGATFTMVLLHGSPALETGDDALLNPPYGLASDQRGFPRKAGAHVDIGAFGFQPIASGPMLTSTGRSDAGEYQLIFTHNSPGATFTVLSTPDLSVPLSDWAILGAATQTSAGHFQFSDPQMTDKPMRFYRVSSP